MDSTWLIKARALRDEAYEALLTNPAYLAFKAFDDTVVSLGGAPMFELRAPSSPVHEAAKRVMETAAKKSADGFKIAQGDAAEIVLRNASEPLTLGDLMGAAMSRGAEIRGVDPLANFRSTLSKDHRFKAFRHGSQYLWWLGDRPLPPAWNETTVLTSTVSTVASSDPSDQKGGDGDAPSTT